LVALMRRRNLVSSASGTLDKSESPHRWYSISGNGKPTLLPRQ
jgi:hypothetical protein